MTQTPARPVRTVVEVAMEMALPTDVLEKVEDAFGLDAAQTAGMSTSVGGIGPLLRERIVSQAEQGDRVIGVSILYNTVWTQGWQNWNHLFLQRVPAGKFLRDTLEDTGTTLDLILFDGTRVPVKVWRAAYGRADVYFLDAPELGDVVYPCAEDAPLHTPDPHHWADRQRLLHSWLVGRGALLLLKHLNVRPDVVVLSETPTLFAHPRLVTDHLATDPLFADTRVVFNDHTPLEYAHPIWPRATLELTRMNPDIYTPFVRNGQIDVTQLLVAVSDGVYGVAEKHARVMRAMPSLKPYADKIRHITNGVSAALWQDRVFRLAEQLTDEDLIRARERLKGVFVDWLWRRTLLWPDWAQQARSKPILLWTRRITSYKRLDLLDRIFNDALRRKRFLDADVILVVGGRVYQRDNASEKMVYELVEGLNQDPTLGERVVFLHNFNIFEAPRLYQGADGAIMLSDDGREASATGFMKSQMNGGVVIANPDGAVPEFVAPPGDSQGRPANGFLVSYAHGAPDPDSFLDALAAFSAAHRDPAKRASLMRAAIAMTPRLDTVRTAREMAAFFDVLPVPARGGAAL